MAIPQGGRVERKLRAVEQKCESITKYDTVFDDDLKEALKLIIAELKKCESELSEGDGGSRLKELRQLVSSDLERIIALKRLSKQLRDAYDELREAEIKFREAESKTSASCSEYVERRGEYIRARRKVEDAAKTGISEIKQRFLENASSILADYELKIAGQEITPGLLFEVLVESPEVLDKAVFVQKSMPSRILEAFSFGRDKKKAKRSVLEHAIREAIAGIAPIKQKEAEELRKLESRFSDLKELESRCKKAEEVRQRLDKSRKEAHLKIARLEKDPLFEYSKQDKLSSMKESYLRILKSLQ